MLYYMLNKPGGCITARKDISHKTVMDYFPENMREILHPVGRLDMDTTGLLIFTDDGKLDMEIMQPENHVPKKYFFRAIGTMDEVRAKKVESGVLLTGQTELTKPAVLEVQNTDKIINIIDHIPQRFRQKMSKNPDIPVFSGYLTITEGRKHQVKRMLRAVGCCVVSLKRVAVGSLFLDESLKPGEYRELTANELTLLKQK